MNSYSSGLSTASRASAMRSVDRGLGLDDISSARRASAAPWRDAIATFGGFSFLLVPLLSVALAFGAWLVFSTAGIRRQGTEVDDLGTARAHVAPYDLLALSSLVHRGVGDGRFANETSALAAQAARLATSAAEME